MSLQTIKLPFPVKKPVCAFGSQIKNTIAYAAGSRAWLSPVHDDLMTPAGLAAFENDASVFLRKRPRVIAYDMHPGYQSSLFARGLPPAYALRPVQHHHAHIAACMAENGLRQQKVIGVAFDGTGFGADETIWGAEFLVCDYAGYERAGHLKTVPLIGGEAAIHQPWRVAAALLQQAYGNTFVRIGIDFCRKIDRPAWAAMMRMCAAGVNSPPASSMGRLFDAAASLVFARPAASHEAELAIVLEKTAAQCVKAVKAYPFSIRREKGVYILDPLPLMKAIVGDILGRRSREEIALAFHRTVAGMIRAACGRLRTGTGINAVVLSGGVFQNTILLESARDLLYKDGFHVYSHARLPPSDASLSLGQAVIAAHQ